MKEKTKKIIKDALKKGGKEALMAFLTVFVTSGMDIIFVQNKKGN